MDERTEDARKLDYATPACEPAGFMAAGQGLGCFWGLLLGVLAAGSLFCGAVLAVAYFKPSTVGGPHGFEVIMFLLIGAVCAYFAWRWVRWAVRERG